MKILLSEEQYGKLIVTEDINEGGPVRTNEQWLDELKRKYPNWDYSNAVIYHDGVRKKIKNVYCKIHNHSFPEKGDNEINVNDQLRRGQGCRECAKEVQAQKVSKKLTKTEKQWKKELSNIEHLKNKCDFSKSKISNSTGKPIVTNIYCKKHKKFFNGGNNEEGTSTYRIPNQENICPDCMKDNFFEKKATSFEDWIDKFNVLNKNYNYSKSEVWYENKLAWVNNIVCNVKGLDGKKHGLFAEDGVMALGHSKGQGQCPKCECESKQKNFIEDSIKIHKNKYLYDKVDFCDDSTIIRKQGLNRTLSHRKVLIGCKKPNHGYFFQYVSTHKSGSGCPICRESKGENYIKDLLSSFNLNFVREKKFAETGGMEFDFYIPKFKVLIEYDGEGHFYPVFGSSEYSRNINYNGTFKRDNLKNKFVKTNSYGIKLIRIPYTIGFSEINGPLLEAIKNSSPNQITYIGDYPRRHGRKEPENKFKINEAKLSFENILTEKLRDMVSIPIYHHTTEERALGIMNSNMLKGSKQYEEVMNLDRTLKQSKHKTMVSFTRDKNFIPDGSIGNSGDGPRIKPDMLNVIFVADRSRLKSRYRVVPFDYGTIANKAWMDPVPRTHKNPEVEERVLTDRIYPLRQYLTNIIYTGQDPEVQKKIDEYLSGIK